MADGGAKSLDPYWLEKLQAETLSSCHVSLRNKLDIDEVVSRMDEKTLLTADDRHFLLLDMTRSREQKVAYIINMLPRKGEGWWNKFIASLSESTLATAHKYLASMLNSQLRRKIFKSQGGQQNFETDSLSRDMYHLTHNMYSTQVSSGISLDMFKFMPDMMPASDLANAVQPKEKLTNIEYCFKVMKNQVGLLQAFDELLEKIKRFRDALFDLIQLYIDKFKIKKQQSYLQLTKLEQNVIHIIEDITESTEDINIDKEREVWTKCVTKIEKNHELIKMALYSQETSKMVMVQIRLKLDNTEAKAAREWIAARNKLVVLGKDGLVKLDEMRNQDNPLITSIYDIFHRRVKTGEDCLKAWVKWVDQRIKL